MSSTTITTTNENNNNPVERQTYWCHHCDMSVSLLSYLTPPLLCPHCTGDFLELMDTSNSGDNYLLDSPAFHRLIHHLSTHHPPFDLDDDEFPNFTPNPHPNSSSDGPASKAFMDSIPTFKITYSLLELDPLLLCAICKDEFMVDVDVKQLPCKHLYHPDCILPWLGLHNSCPVCRFQLPIEEPPRAFSPLGFGDVLRSDEQWVDWSGDEDQDAYGIGYMSSRDRAILIHRAQMELRSVLSSTQMAQQGGGELGAVERTSSVETVSSRPVEGGAGLNGGVGDEEMSSSRDRDADISGIKVSSSSVSENSR